MNTAICFECGSPKPDALGACQVCGSLPRTHSQCVTSIALSDRVSSEKQLAQYAYELRGGQRLSVPFDALVQALDVQKEPIQLSLWPENKAPGGDLTLPAAELPEIPEIPTPSETLVPPRAVYRTLQTLVFALLLLAWLEQDAIALYWRQTHHADAPILSLKAIPAWASGARANALSVQLDAARSDGMARFDAWAVSAFNARFPPETPLARNVAGMEMESGPVERKLTPALNIPDARAAETGSPTERKTPSALADPDGHTVPLDKEDRVLFVGDSLMQGVAPHVNASLLRRYAIRGLDLSRQSTGLSYPGFFDWPEQIKKTFLETAGIKLLVVFLGPNDPWDLPAARGERYLKFRSEQWENTYRARIREILETARENGARVLWLAPPCMREKELSQKMAYLNELFSDEVGKHHELYLPTDKLVGCDGVRFDGYMSAGGKKIRSRFNDGIHFTLAGQKRIAEAILAFIHFTPRETAP